MIQKAFHSFASLWVEAVVSSVSYLPQPGIAKIKMFFSWFWRIFFKEAKRRSEERYRFMLSGFLFILMVLYKFLFSCHKTWKLQKPLWVQNYQTQEEIKHSLAITLFRKMLQDFMATAKYCRPQITAKGICRRTWHAETSNFLRETSENLFFHSRILIFWTR